MSITLSTRFRSQLRQASFLQPVIRYFRAGRIKSGVGAGLWFDPGISNHEYKQGNNEIPVQEIFSRYLGSSDVFYDIGANVGFFTVIAARLVGSSGQVYAFEPVPDNIEVLRRNLKANGFANVIVSETAVSDKSGSGELQLAHDAGGATLSSAAPPPDWKGTLAVELLAIDDLIATKQASPPNFVKIDVEGTELAVLHGMQKTIETYRPLILFEIDDDDKKRFQHKVEACCAYLQWHGYQIESLADSYPNEDWFVSHYFAH